MGVPSTLDHDIPLYDKSAMDHFETLPVSLD